MSDKFLLRADKKLLTKVHQDASRFGRSANTLINHIIKDFYQEFTVGQREKIFHTLPVRRSGRRAQIHSNNQ